MTHTPSQDPWNASADTEQPLSVGEPTDAPAKKRRGPILISFATAAVVVAVGGGLIFASGVARNRPTSPPSAAVDSAGKEACGIAKLVSLGDVDRVSVNAIHDDTIKSTHTDLVYRGNELFDAFNSLTIQQATGQITPAEAQLRIGSPLLQFQTACTEAGYGS